MRVNRFPTTRLNRRLESSKQILTKEAVGSTTFDSNLKSSLKDQLKQKLNTMLKDIDAQGKHMLSHRTMPNVLEYKRMVKIFLNTAIANMYHLKENFKTGPKGKRDILIIIENIDKSIEDLMKLVLNKETDNIKLLDKVGEIRGLLIDLYS